MTKIEISSPEANRARVAAGYCNEFYNQQKNIERGWELGTIAPKGLVLGELPEINLKQLRFDSSHRVVLE